VHGNFILNVRTFGDKTIAMYGRGPLKQSLDGATLNRQVDLHLSVANPESGRQYDTDATYACTYKRQ
jgi:hypothetical protein